MIDVVKSSCKGCDKRHVNCHSTCEDYKAFRKARDEQNEEIRKKKSVEAHLDEHEIKRARRIKRWYCNR